MNVQDDRPRTAWLRHAIMLLATLLTTSAHAEEHFEPEGRMVPVAGAMLHLLCTGSGAPTVVLEAGLGANHLDWSLVQPKLATSRRVCSYDRAGAGWSTRAPAPRSVDNINQDLHDLVRAASIARPFILVGHSFGGLASLAYARRFPEDVAGLVLLDAMHPEQFERFEAAGVHLDTDPHMVLGRTPLFAATYGLPPALHGLAIHLAGTDSARANVVREMSLMLDDAAAVQAAGYPHLPARVAIHGNREWDAAYPDGRMEAVWTDLQGELARALGAPPPVRVAGSGHQMALDAPDAVAALVLDLGRP